MTGGTIPVLPRGVRLHHDKVRSTNVLLGPERAMMLDDISHVILLQIDGQRSIDDICKDLAETYAAPIEQITKDTTALLSDLANKRLLEAVNG